MSTPVGGSGWEPGTSKRVPAGSGRMGVPGTGLTGRQDNPAQAPIVPLLTVRGNGG